MGVALESRNLCENTPPMRTLFTTMKYDAPRRRIEFGDCFTSTG